MTLSENMVKKSAGVETKSGLTKRASSEMESSPQEPYELPSKACEAEAAKMCSSNIHMNKSVGAYDSLPPNLTESESKPKSESKPEADQECTAEVARHRRRFDPAPVAEGTTSTDEVGAVEPNNDNDKGNSDTKKM